MLEPGDITAAGARHRDLSGFQDSDKIGLEVERCGRLTISVRDDLKRAWSRETRRDLQNKRDEQWRL